jgi:hypothetical protein
VVSSGHIFLYLGFFFVSTRKRGCQAEISKHHAWEKMLKEVSVIKMAKVIETVLEENDIDQEMGAVLRPQRAVSPHLLLFIS